jgi:hypothetical protein
MTNHNLNVHEFTNTITGDTARANVRTIIAFGRLISNATTCGECQNDHCIKRIKDEDCRRLRPTMLFEFMVLIEIIVRILTEFGEYDRHLKVD